MAIAAALGEPVEVLGLRSETQQVFATADGTLQAQISLRPVRVHRADGSWVPVDTSLSVRPDGTVAPGATTVDLAFSGGGTGPLVRMSREDRALSLSWPQALPAPVLSGDTATYPEVWPGVDLRVRADVDGFAEELVVKSREAASNPALTTVRLGMQTEGVQVVADASGALKAVDSVGGAVFQAPVPVMWDAPTVVAAAATGTDGGTAPDPLDVPGEHSADVGVQVDAGSLSLVPDQSVLTGADTVYPVVVDPSWTSGAPAWTEVNQEDPNSATWRTVPSSIAAGFQDFTAPWSRVRSFMRFGISSGIYGTHVLSATLRMFENWSPSCTARAVDLWVTGGFSSSTTWNNQPTWGSHIASAVVAKGHDAGCPAGGVEFNVTSAIAGAAKNHTGITFGIKAADENDHLGWKKFNTNPVVTVVYNHKPNTPTASVMSTSNPTSSCSTSKTSAPKVNVTLLGGITLRVKATDPDGNKVKVAFDFRQDFGTSALAAPVSAAVASGTTVSATVMQNKALTNGQLYAWRALVQDVNSAGSVMDSSAWSAWCFALQDSSAPAPPGVSSLDYPTDAYPDPAKTDRPGIFTFVPGAAADTDITSYCFGVDQPSAPTCTAASADHTLSVLISPPSYGPHDLFVKARDGANNTSSAFAYHFYANAPTNAVAYWKFDENHGTTATGTDEQNLTATGPTGPTVSFTSAGVSWQPSGKVNSAAHFDGVSGAISADSARVDTSQSFTVSAWVRLTSNADYATAVSQDGNRMSGFYLQYSKADDRWGIAMQSADSDTFTTVRASSTAAPQLNVWTHLAGVYNVSDHTLRLYVNGGLNSTVTNNTPWNALGTVQIGRAKSRGVLSNYWPGDLDEVRVYSRALSAGEIADIVNHDLASSPMGAWAFDETGGATAADSSGRNHPATLDNGATFTTDGRSGGGLALDGVTGSAHTAASVTRTDQSFSVAAWAKLDRTDGTFTIASQDGGSTGGFVLQFQPDGLFGQWVFSLSPEDDTEAPASNPAVVSLAADPTGTWVHVAGIYDAFTHRLELRVVDSTTRVAYGSQPSPWNASGAVQLGRDRTVDDAGAVVYQDYLPGVVDDLRVYAGTLFESDLRVLAGQS